MLKGTAELVRSLKPNVLVRVMVPSVDHSLRALASIRFQRQIEKVLLAVATGTTTYRAVGAWRNGGPQPVRERVLIVESYLPARVTKRDRWQIVECLCAVARAAKQDALLVAVDGRPFLLAGLGTGRH